MKQKELLFSVTHKDFEIDTFCTGGPGGQKQNRSKKGVRIRHPASGAVGEGREFREQIRNKEAAFRRLTETETFRKWLQVEAARRMGQRVPETPEEIMARVDRMIEGGLKNGEIVFEEPDLT